MVEQRADWRGLHLVEWSEQKWVAQSDEWRVESRGMSSVEMMEWMRVDPKVHWTVEPLVPSMVLQLVDAMEREMVERWVLWMAELRDILSVEKSVTTLVDAMVVRMVHQ
jgi:hypothetical protein